MAQATPGPTSEGVQNQLLLPLLVARFRRPAAFPEADRLLATRARRQASRGELQLVVGLRLDRQPGRPGTGDGTRHVAVVSATGDWHKSGRGLVPIRWLFVHDRSGAHREEYFFTTDPGLTPAAGVAYRLGLSGNVTPL